MEDTLRDKDFISCMISPTAVLILVLMEDTLRELWNESHEYATRCLNPCFNGRYSQRDC